MTRFWGLLFGINFEMGRSGPRTRHARRRHAEVHPRGRQAQRPRRRGPGHLPPHVLRDAGELVLRRLLQEGGHRVGLGAGDGGLEVPDEPPLRHGLQPAAKATPAISTRRLGIIGRSCSEQRASIRRSHRQRQQEGQLLDDGRHRPLRPLLRVACGPDARTGDTAGRLVNQGSRRVHRNLEPRLHPVQCQPGRHLHPACRQSTSIRAWASSA